MLQGQFGFRLVGFWHIRDNAGTVEDDPPNVVWLIAWHDRNERDSAWDAAKSSASWSEITRDIPAYHRRPGNVRFLEGIWRSPLQ